MAVCSVAYIDQHKRQEVWRGVECEVEPVRWGVMCELVTRAHLAGVPTSRSIWSHVAAALDLHQQPPSHEVVSQLVNGTVGHSSAVWAPRDPTHSREVLTWLAEQWRARGWPVPPEFSPEVVPIPPRVPELFYKTYLGLGGSESVTLLESGGGIAHNTTGLTSWCGSAMLAEWATNYPKVVAGRRVLELGAGVGLAACVLLASPAPPAAYIATDCHHHVLHLLHHNLSINLTTPPPKREDLEKFQEWMSEEVRRGEVEAGEVMPWTPPSGHTLPHSPSTPPVAVVRCAGCSEGGRRGDGEVDVMQVDWRAPPPLPPVDVVVAADVVYDEPLIPPLLTLIRSVLDGSAFDQTLEGDARVTQSAKTGSQMQKTGESNTDKSRAKADGDLAECKGKLDEEEIVTDVRKVNSGVNGTKRQGDSKDSSNEPQREAYLACTRRSQETMLAFLEGARRVGLTADLVYQNCLDADRALFVYNETHLPIKVYRLTLAGRDET